MSLSSLIEPSINGEYLAHLFTYLEKRDLPRSFILKSLPEISENYASTWIKARHLNQVYELASEHLSDPHLGLKFGAKFSANSFQIVGFIAISAPNILAAFETVSCFQGLYSRIGKMVIRQQEQVLMCWDANWPRTLMSHHAVEASIAGWLKVSIAMTQSELKPLKISFKHSQQGDIETYQKFFSCPLEFDQEYDAIHWQKNQLNEVISSSNALVHEALVDKSRQVLQTIGHEPLVDKIEIILGIKGAGSILPIEAVARELSIKPAYLSKQLKKGGLSYRTLVDRSKLLECLPYILDTHNEIVDIAQVLGFSEQSSFTRAFKRWTDMSPLMYRNMLLQCKA